ncbi:MFS transporter [Microbispora siamensis]|uniref:MFS transporter n=1 Tax=Microbispora siamensis TaxID=564413 RepID=UPI00194FCF49
MGRAQACRNPVLAGATGHSEPHIISIALSSLIGDFFPPGERARVYGFILSGEMLGVGFGLLVGGNLPHLLSWRAAFYLLALFGILLVIVITRKLPEPARGGQGRLRPDGHPPDAERDAGTPPSRSDAVHFALRDRGVDGPRGKHAYVPSHGCGGRRPRDLRIPGRRPRLGRRHERAGPAVHLSDHACAPDGERDHPAPRQALLSPRRATAAASEKPRVR